MTLQNCYDPNCCEVMKMNTATCGEMIENYPIAMAYVPWQKWKKVYSEDVALERGTIFPELDLPFLGEEVM